MPTKLTAPFQDAIALAIELHGNQTRKGTKIPYVSHLLAVAALVLEHGGTEEESIAALLHDAVEDAGGAATRDRIATQFGEDVASIVDGCSDASPAPGEPKAPWRKRKKAHIAHLAGASPSVLLVTAADKLHNARAIVTDYDYIGEQLWDRFNATREDIVWYHESLRDVMDSVETKLKMAEPEGSHRYDGLRRLLDRFDEAVEELRFETMLRDTAALLAEPPGWADLLGPITPQ